MLKICYCIKIKLPRAEKKGIIEPSDGVSGDLRAHVGRLAISFIKSARSWLFIMLRKIAARASSCIFHLRAILARATLS